MSDDGRSGDQRNDELSDELADRAGLQLMAAAAADRAAVLQSLVDSHPRHERALRRLAADLERVDGVLADSYALRGAEPAAETIDHVGGHRVLRRLGEGAFGVVYLCQQERPVTRLVAVKVVRPGAGGPETVRRFAAERQLLAALNHPAITQVFDAGELADGRPFFVMEYVDGKPIRAYCDDKALAVRGRLRLFQEVCRGVAHAHARGIVHRDLKPANVLVVDTDAGPVPKIIDFGIAKALAAARDGGPVTEAGRVVGTPGYMSPEQASGRTDEVDARADVFALGVILHELLTGALPWARGASATTADAPRPSVCVAPRRQLAAELRGDLDWITLKALARERDDRYPTVAAFASDVESHLLGETVSVGPPSLRYRWGKFVRRNRGAVLVAIGALFVLALGFAFFQLRTSDAETTAERAMAQALSAVERLVARAGDERLRQAAENDAVRQMLAQDALGFYDQWLRERPLDRRERVGRCRALVSLSAVHLQLGQFSDAERIGAEAAAEARELFAATPDDLAMRGLLADALRRHGRALMLVGREPDALPLFVDAVEHLELCNRSAPKDYALSLSSAWRELCTARDVGKQIEASLDAARRSVLVIEELIASGLASPTAHTDVEVARDVLVYRLIALGRAEEAAGVAAAAEAALPNVTLDVHRVTARVHASWAMLARQRRDWPTAIAHAKLNVAAGERWHQQEPARIFPAAVLMEDLTELAALCDKAEDWAESNRALQRAIAIADAMVANFPGDVGRLARLEGVLHESAFRLYERQLLPDLEQAQAWMQRALDTQTTIAERGGRPHRDRAQTLTLLAMITAARGQATAATWDAIAAVLPVDVDVTADGREFDFAGWIGVAESRMDAGRLDDAAAALAQAERWVGDPPKRAGQATDALWVRARLALRRGDVDAANAAAERILVVRPKWMGRWRAADCQFAIWRHLDAATERVERTATAHRDRAAELYRDVIQALDKDVIETPDDPWPVVPWGFAGLQLATIEVACDRPAAARDLLEPALSALARVAPIAHRDLWQPDTLARGQALRADLAARGGR